MPWSSPLSRPILLRDGRVLRTLREAAEFILGLGGDYQKAAWTRYAAELLILAAEGGKEEDVVNATMQVERALKREGFVR